MLKIRFVYEAVYGPTPYGSMITAKDGDRTNAKLSNIEYRTRKEYFNNHDWSMKAKVSKENVERILKDREDGLSYRALAEKYNVSLSTIQKILKGEYFNQ